MFRDEPGKIRLQAPVVRLNGNLVIKLPPSEVGDRLIYLARGISEIADGFLQINLPPALMSMLGIGEGMMVSVDDEGGTLNIYPVGMTSIQLNSLDGWVPNFGE